MPGSFVYTPAAGTVLSAGAGQTLSVTFTPTDTSDYNSVTTTATINVLRVQLSVVAADKSMNYGSSVSALTDTITGFVNGDQAGVVSGSPGLSTSASGASHPGSYAINVNVSGLSATNYSFAAKNGTLTIGRATPTITWAKPTDITYGTALGATQLDATTTVPGSFVYTPAAGTVLSAGAGQTLSVTFTPTDTSDYNSVTITATINVSRAQLTVAAADKSMTYGSSVPALTDTITGFVNGDQAGVISGTPGLSTSASGASNPGSYAINVNVSGLSATNYSFAAQSGTLTIRRGPATHQSGRPGEHRFRDKPLPRLAPHVSWTRGYHLLGEPARRGHVAARRRVRHQPIARTPCHTGFAPQGRNQLCCRTPACSCGAGRMPSGSRCELIDLVVIEAKASQPRPRDWSTIVQGASTVSDNLVLSLVTCISDSKLLQSNLVPPGGASPGGARRRRRRRRLRRRSEP